MMWVGDDWAEDHHDVPGAVVGPHRGGSGDQSRDRGDERVERTRGEARPDPVEQLCD
jgi:hypothetical protein